MKNDVQVVCVYDRVVQRKGRPEGVSGQGLTEREKEALILFVGFGYDFDSIGKLLGITPERARDYKYNGLKKARAKKNGRRKNHN